MKKGLVLALMGLGISLMLAGCSTYSGGMGDEYGTTYGTADDLPSPGGFDRAKGKHTWNTTPQARPAPTQNDIGTVPEEEVNTFPR